MPRRIYRRRGVRRYRRRSAVRRVMTGIDYHNNPLKLMKLRRHYGPGDIYTSRSVLDKLRRRKGTAFPTDIDPLPPNSNFGRKLARFGLGVLGRNVRAVLKGLPGLGLLSKFVADPVQDMTHWLGSKISDERFEDSDGNNALLSFLDGERRKGDIMPVTEFLGNAFSYGAQKSLPSDFSLKMPNIPRRLPQLNTPWFLKKTTPLGRMRDSVKARESPWYKFGENVKEYFTWISQGKPRALSIGNDRIALSPNDKTPDLVRKLDLGSPDYRFVSPDTGDLVMDRPSPVKIIPWDDLDDLEPNPVVEDWVAKYGHGGDGTVPYIDKSSTPLPVSDKIVYNDSLSGTGFTPSKYSPLSLRSGKEVIRTSPVRKVVRDAVPLSTWDDVDEYAYSPYRATYRPPHYGSHYIEYNNRPPYDSRTTQTTTTQPRYYLF